MALAKKGSRVLTVDGVRYRWKVSPDSGYMVVVVERAEALGQRLTVRTDYDDSDAGAQRQAISPATLRTIVLGALELGWDPEKRGETVQLRMQGQRLVPRYTVVRGPWAVGRGPWAVGRGPWSVVRGPWSVVRGPWAVGRGPWAVGRGPWAVVRGPWSVGRGPRSVGARLC